MTAAWRSPRQLASGHMPLGVPLLGRPVSAPPVGSRGSAAGAVLKADSVQEFSKAGFRLMGMTTCVFCGASAALGFIGGYRCQSCEATFTVADAFNVLASPGALPEHKLVARLTLLRAWSWGLLR